MSDYLYNVPVPDNTINQQNDNPTFPSYCPEDKAQIGRPNMPPTAPMSPVPSVVSGMDLYEAMNQLNDRVNVCIHNYNAVMSENYKTLHNLQRAAQENGAYYGPGEVWVEEGYNADEGATYHLIHKACVDRRGEPIRMQLHLAYGNTTNSKIEQPMFSASKVEFADKMVVAIPKGDKGWYGKTIWHGCPIASAEEETLWTVGFTQGGVMRVYNNGVTVDQMLRDTIENAMGVSGVLIQNGQICDESYTKYIPQRDEQASRIVMGQVLATREVVILTVGRENEVNRKGLTSATCAQILKQYGCDIAIELCEGSGSGAMDKGSLMYVPDDTAEPSMYAYWFISRKCFYKNDYERELAELVQNYGACLWQGFLNKKAIAKVKSELDDEIERAKAGEEALNDEIDAETERAKYEEQRIEGKLGDEIDRAKSEEARIEKKADDETNRAKGEEQRIETKVDNEIARSTAEDERLDGKIDGEVTRAKAAENVLQENIDAEVDRAKTAENTLDEKIDKEIHDRTNADATLHQEILTEQGARVAADEILQGNINTETEARVAGDNTVQAHIDKEVSDRQTADAQLQSNIDKEVSDRQTAIDSTKTELNGKIASLTSRVTQCESDISSLETLTNTLQEQMSSLDTTVASALATVSNIEQTMNSLKTSVSTLTDSLNTLSDDVQNLTKDLDAIESNLDAEISRAKEAESAIQSSIEGNYVKKTGDTMTGNLTVQGKTLVSDDESTINSTTLEPNLLRYTTVTTYAGNPDYPNTEHLDVTTSGGTLKLSYSPEEGTEGQTVSIKGVSSTGTDDSEVVNWGALNLINYQLTQQLKNKLDYTELKNPGLIVGNLNAMEYEEPSDSTPAFSARMKLLASGLRLIAKPTTQDLSDDYYIVIEKPTNVNGETAEPIYLDNTAYYPCWLPIDDNYGTPYVFVAGQVSDSDNSHTFDYPTVICWPAGSSVNEVTFALGYVKLGAETISQYDRPTARITNVADGVNDDDAVNVKQFVLFDEAVSETVSALQSSITAEANRAESAESAIKGDYVKKSGDTMTGSLTFANTSGSTLAKISAGKYGLGIDWFNGSSSYVTELWLADDGAHFVGKNSAKVKVDGIADPTDDYDAINYKTLKIYMPPAQPTIYTDDTSSSTEANFWSYFDRDTRTGNLIFARSLSANETITLYISPTGNSMTLAGVNYYPCWDIVTWTDNTGNVTATTNVVTQTMSYHRYYTKLSVTATTASQVCLVLTPSYKLGA